MTPRRRLRIQTRLTLWYAATFFLTGAVLLIVVYVLAARTFVAANADLASTFGAIHSGIYAPEQSEAAPKASPSPVVASPLERGTVAVTPPGDAAHATKSDSQGATVPTAKPEGEYLAAVERSRRTALRSIVVQSALLFVAMTAIGLLLCWLIANRALRPLRHITVAAERLSHDTIDSRIEHAGPADELKTLTDTFNAMLDRLGQAFQAQQLFAANASHELRTPLTIIQTAAEKALSRPSRSEQEYRIALTTIVAAVQRSARLVASLLTLAQLRQRVRRERLDLADLAATTTTMGAIAGPTLVTDLAPAPVTADPILVELLLRNLLENANRYNTPSGSVWLRTATRGDQAIIEVENTGPPVPPAHLAGLRQPFQRGTHRTGGREGHGLGLSIVDAVVAAHTGNWTATARPEGGLLVTVSFPGPGIHADAEDSTDRRRVNRQAPLTGHQEAEHPCGLIKS